MQKVVPYTPQKADAQDSGLGRKVRNTVLAALGVTGLIVFASKVIKKKVAAKSDSKSFQDGTPETNAKLIKMAFENDGWFGTDVKALREVLTRIKSREELEKIRKEYEKQFGSPLYADMMKELQSTEYKEMMQIIEGKSDKAGQPLTDKQYTAWAKRLKAAFDKMYGFIPGTDEAAIKTVFNEIPSQQAFINVGKAYGREYKSNMIDDLKKELEVWEYPDYMKIITSKKKS